MKCTYQVLLFITTEVNGVKHEMPAVICDLCEAERELERFRRCWEEANTSLSVSIRFCSYRIEPFTVTWFDDDGDD